MAEALAHGTPNPAEMTEADAAAAAAAAQMSNARLHPGAVQSGRQHQFRDAGHQRRRLVDRRPAGRLRPDRRGGRGGGIARRWHRHRRRAWRRHQRRLWPRRHRHLRRRHRRRHRQRRRHRRPRQRRRRQQRRRQWRLRRARRYARRTVGAPGEGLSGGYGFGATGDPANSYHRQSWWRLWHQQRGRCGELRQPPQPPRTAQRAAAAAAAAADAGDGTQGGSEGGVGEGEGGGIGSF